MATHKANRSTTIRAAGALLGAMALISAGCTGKPVDFGKVESPPRIGNGSTAQAPSPAPSASGGEIKSMQDFQVQVLQSDKPVLVDFGAPWCHACKDLSPIIDSLKSEYEGKATIVKVDIDQAPDVRSQYKVKDVPTVIVFKKGQPTARIVGFNGSDAYRRALDAARG